MNQNSVVTAYFAKFIQDNLGIIYNESNLFQLESRLSELLVMFSMKTLDELMAAARNGLTPEMKQMILDVATNNETSFFRDKELFQSIAEGPLSTSRFNGVDGKPLKIWCCASSSGQEPYSISMILEQQRKTFPARRFSIVATDISDRVLKRAKEGKYSKLEVDRGLSPELLSEFFDAIPSASSQHHEYTVKSTIKSQIEFKKLNLLDLWPENFGPFDIIFCRNVLIYQSVENKKKVIAKIAKLMNPGGILILGAAESLIGLSEEFKLVYEKKATYYQRQSSLAA